MPLASEFIEYLGGIDISENQFYDLTVDERSILYNNYNTFKKSASGNYHSPKRSIATSNNCFHSPIANAYNKNEECLFKCFQDFKEQDIKLYFPAWNTNEAYSYNNQNKETFTSFLSSLTFTSYAQTVEIDSSNTVNIVDFQADKLKYLTEICYQDSVLSPLSTQDSNVADTHQNNSSAKYLCVSGSKDSTITFDAKPDCINKYSPMLLEVKSRRQSNANINVESTDDITQSMSSINLINITETEIELFIQCMDRIVAQSQFRACLSKLIVLASTGHVSWCFYYEQQFESEPFRQVKVFLISTSDINIIWNGFSKRVEDVGCKFFLTNHGVAILSTLTKLTRVNLHSIRVHLSNVSNAAVYYVTYPTNEKVSSVKKDYAFKLMSDQTNFVNEITNLRIIREYWHSNKSDRPFYYITDSDENFEGLLIINNRLRPLVQSYDWFKSLSNISHGIGVIIMEPALRKSEMDQDNKRLIFSQLFDSISTIHRAGILHCDIRPSNCLKFDGGWQVVDFDLAVRMTTSDSGNCRLIIGTEQQKNSGHRIQKETEGKTNGTEINVKWLKTDDIEMLNYACSRMYDITT